VILLGLETDPAQMKFMLSAAILNSREEAFGPTAPFQLSFVLCQPDKNKEPSFIIPP
jgi:hypothetical protein